MKSKVKLADVARCAGVAVGTASRVLNNRTDVNPEARAKVLEAVAKLQYSPLRKRKGGRGTADTSTALHHNIGVVILGMHESLINVPVMGEILHGIEAEISLQNANLMFTNLPRADRVPAFLKHNQVEGLIVKTSQYGKLPSAAENPLVKHILRFPIVWVWARPEGAPGDLCSFNHETAGLLAARHLQELGHQHVAFLNPKKGKSSLEHIKREFINACKSFGLEHMLLEAALPRGTVWPEPALTSSKDVLPLVETWKNLPKAKRPTALFVPADNIAVHVYTALEQNGFKVGRDVSVIACNFEKSLAQALNPKLTTIDVHAEKIGRKSVDQLFWRMDNIGEKNDQTLLFEPVLIEGESVRDLKRKPQKVAVAS